ncbi:MAG TPA: phosphatidate cytidylyltransferase [Bdellovibrionales bacterium]|nr:phosphatidate cytidylyltransferase [Bdellovibrionales bacterium]
METPEYNRILVTTRTVEGTRPLKLRNDLHIARRVWHVCGVLLIVAIFNLVPRPVSLGLLVAAIGIFIPLDLLRTRKPALNRIALNWFDAVMRNSEVHQLSGLSYLLFGTFIIVYLFPAKIVTLALLMLAVGDPTSSVVGILYGKDKIFGNKSLQGALGGFAVCSLVALIYYLSTGLMMDRILLATLLTGVIGMLAEVIPIGRLDDNLTFPVIASTLLWLLFYLFGGFV